MRRAGRTAWAWALAVSSLACTSARPAPCPGETIASVPLHADIVLNEGGCAFVYGSAADVLGANGAPGTLSTTGVKASFDLLATFALADDGTALVCPSRAEASPLQGTLQGEHLAVAGAIMPGYLPTTVCACALQATETLEGTFVRADDGSVRFAGQLRNVLAAGPGVDAGACEPAPTAEQPGPRCGAPCELHWTVSGSRS